MREKVLTHILCYLNQYYHFQSVELVMRITLHINNDIKNFEQVFSVEHIIMSIKELQAQLRTLESKQPYQIATPPPI